MIKTSNLTKRFDGLIAVNDVNISIEENHISGVIGPNGSGKTTLFNLLSGFFPPSEGRIVFNGEDITQMPPNKRVHRGIVRTFQLVSVFDSLTVWENLVLSTYRTKSDKKDKVNFFFTNLEKDIIKIKCMESLEKVGLVEKASASTGSLSYGDKRMLEIGISLSLDPKMLLLDEPLAGLSAHEIAQVIELIQKVKKNITIVIIEHKISKIIDVVHSLHVMNAGELICEGKPHDVIQDEKVRECYWGKEGTNCLM